MSVEIPDVVDRAGGSELWGNAFSGSELAAPVPPAVPSRDLWRGTPLAGLAPGMQRVTVRHIDVFRREQRAGHSLRLD